MINVSSGVARNEEYAPAIRHNPKERHKRLKDEVVELAGMILGRDEDAKQRVENRTQELAHFNFRDESESKEAQ